MEEVMRLKCPRPDCGHEWDYKGSSRFYLTCPHCYRKIPVEKAKKAAQEAEE
jgi:hypothetical protein